MPETETETETPIEGAELPRLGSDDRVDAHANEVFQYCLGYKPPFPDLLVRTYNDLKRVKDSIRGGRLSVEGFAFVEMLYRQQKQFEELF